MKKIFKSFIVALVLLFSLSLTSCDFLNVLFDQTEQSPDKGKTGTDDGGNNNDPKKDDDPKEDDPKEDDPKDNPPVETNRSEIDYTNITIDSFVSNYQNQYSYKEFAKDEIYAAEMTEAYKTFYNKALEVLKSNENYEVKTDTKTATTYFEIAKYESTNQELIENQIVSVILQIIRENPAFYFLASSYSIGYSTTSSILGSTTTYYALLIGSGEFATAESRTQMNTRIINYANLLIQDKDVNNKTDYQIVELLNTNLMANITYAYQNGSNIPEDSPWAHSISGLYLYNKGVCECYAKNFKLFCDLLKVEAMFVIGIGNGGNHAWNVVKLNSNWYGIDVTWNDTTGNSYFLLGQEFNTSHTINPSVYGPNYQVPIPTLSETNYSN